jgi:putative flippase GtrA
MTSIARKFLRFAGVGVFGTIAHYAVLIAIVELIAVDVIIGSSMGFIVGAAVNYVLNYHYTFQSTKDHRETLPKFYFIAVLGFMINGTIVYLLAHVANVNYLIAQVVATALVLVWGFTANYLWTFVEKPSQ